YKLINNRFTNSNLPSPRRLSQLKLASASFSDGQQPNSTFGDSNNGRGGLQLRGIDWGGNGVRHQQQQHYYQNSFDHGNHQSKQHLFRNRHNWNHCNNNTNVSDNFNSNGYQHYSGYQSGFRRGSITSPSGGGARTNEHYLNDAGGIEQDISEIESTSVVIQVWPPSGLTDDDLLEAAYELHLSEKSARGPYSRVFDGQAEEICLRDLQPGQRYWAKSLAKLTDSISGFSLAAQFRTSPAQPAAPALPPELIGRPGANWLALRWAPAARDNGASVTAYVLECAASDRPGGEYQEVYRGPLLHHRCDGLSPGTAYWFRVAAVNALGQGDYSPHCSTSDPAAAANNARAAPERPRPPKRLRLRNSAGAGRYVLVWSAPEDDGGCPIEEYLRARLSATLCRPSSANSTPRNWLPAGRPHSVSVRASSSAGLSEPSESLSVTIPAPPGPPGPPRLRGPPRNGEMRLAWSEPGNDGGAPVTGYEARARLEDDASSSLSSPEATATTTVSSSTLHCSIAKLIPGANYIVTVRAANAAGFGPWSNRLRAVCAPAAASGSIGAERVVSARPPDPMSPLRDAQVNDDAAELTMLDGELVDADLPRVSALVSWEAPKLTTAAATSSSTVSSSGAVTDYRLECRVETGDGEAEEQEFR
uniref:Fibronectin type-III domain-containing protein n=1 Tax=Macrostomum lignano TaxID=282301 RepID=A0A1I8IYT7_9PLAT